MEKKKKKPLFMFLKDEDGVLYEEGAVGEHRKRRAGKRPTANSQCEIDFKLPK